MCAPSVHAIRVRVNENRGVILYRQGTWEPVAAINPSHGAVNGIMTEEGWMLIQHPDKGLIGLPLFGAPSWKKHWDNMDVELDVREGGKWVPIDYNWELIDKALATKS